MISIKGLVFLAPIIILVLVVPAYLYGRWDGAKAILEDLRYWRDGKVDFYEIVEELIRIHKNRKKI